jgi:cytosine/adenosine deaminase-related metal-dependent hydrolase
MTVTLVRDVRPLGQDAVDIVIRDGLIAAIGPGAASTVPAGEAEVIEGGGRLLLPGLVDAHTHMDKTLMGVGWHRHETGPTLRDLIDNERRLRREEGIDSHQQSLRHARAAIATGTTHIRTHVDIDTEIGLAGFEGVQRTREEMADALTMQLVAFPQSGMLVRPGTVDLLEDALRNGADVMGGLDPSTIDRDPVRHLDTVFGLAEKYDVDVDIHLHEPGELGAFAIELIAERTRALGYQGRVVISHAFALGGVDETRLGSLVDLILENDLAIMTHGPGGHRAIPNIKQLKAMGVRLCTGNDGIRDAWGPLNTPDMLERVFIVCYRNNLRRDDDIEDVIRVATEGGANVMKVERYGLAPGCAADLVLVDGETHVEAVISRPARHLVLKHGRVVARDGVCLVSLTA